MKRKSALEKQIKLTFLKDWISIHRKELKFEQFLHTAEFYLTQRIYEKFFSKLISVSESVGKQKMGLLKLRHFEIKHLKSRVLQKLQENFEVEMKKERKANEFLFGLRVKSMKLM